MAKLVFYRSEPALIGGVCAGIARYAGFDVVTVRILAALLCFCSLGLGGIAYLMICLSCPKEEPEELLIDVTPIDFDSEIYGKRTAPKNLIQGAGGRNAKPEIALISARNKPYIILALFVLYSVVTAFVGLGLGAITEGVAWYDFWPLIFIMGALAYLVVPNVHDPLGLRFAIGIPVLTFAFVGLMMTLDFLNPESLKPVLMRSLILILPYGVVLGLGVKKKRTSFVLAAGSLMAAGVLFITFMVGIPGDAEGLFIHLGRQIFIIDNPWYPGLA